jgi:glycerol kinase
MFNTKDSDIIYEATINTNIYQSENDSFAMRSKVEKEIEKLERDGIISKSK